MAPVKRALSSYMLFCNDRRKQVSDANPGLRIGDIQKLISAQWKELSEQEREHYAQLAAKDKERYAQELLANPVEATQVDAATGVDDSACVYQLGRVRKVLQTDPDAGRVNRDALVAIAKATELFVQFVGAKSYEHALFQNRRQIRAADVTRAIQTTNVLDWLRDDFPEVAPVAAAAAAAKSKSAKSAAVTDSASSTRPSGADFFKPQVAATTRNATDSVEATDSVQDTDDIADNDNDNAVDAEAAQSELNEHDDAA